MFFSSMFCRSFSELYLKAIKDAECKPGENQSGEAWVLDEREEEEEAKKEDDDVKTGGVEEPDTKEAQAETDEGEEQLCDKVESERNPYSLLTMPSLPLLRATSLQDQPANQGQEGRALQLPRSFSLEKQLSYSDTCDAGWVRLKLIEVFFEVLRRRHEETQETKIKEKKRS